MKYLVFLLVLCAPAIARADDHGGITAGLDCSACHTSEGWALSSVASASGFDHDRTGFPLRGSHVTTQCTGCHEGKKQLATSCDGCHRDPHQGRMDGACEECHQATEWSDTQALEAHRLTRMPLTGRHATLDCTACHTRDTERTWSDTPTDCYACHAKDYHGTTVHPDHDGSATTTGLPRNCAECHTTAGWTPAVVVPSALPRMMVAAPDHDTWFELSTGPHADTVCSDCHVGKTQTARVRCDGCHDRADLRSAHPGERIGRSAKSCLRCHPKGAAR